MEETLKLANAMNPDGTHHMNKRMVGKSASEIAEIAGLKFTGPTRVLIGEADPSTIGLEDPWSREKMSPILGIYRAKNFDAAVEICARLVRNGGEGHVAVLHTSPGWRSWASTST